MNISLDSCSTESDVFYVGQTSTERSPIRNNTPAILSSTEISGAMERGVITISSVASPEPWNCDAGLWLERPHKALWVWQSAADCSAKSKRPQSAAQPLQWTGNDGRNPSGWWIQPQVTGANHPIPNLNASDERQYYWRVDTTHTTTDNDNFIQMMSPEESTGIFRRATPSTLTSQEMCLSPRALLLLHHLQRDRRED